MPSWGELAVSLRLPSTLLMIKGLSAGQKGAIARDYGLFGAVGADTPEGADIVCEAVRRPPAAGLPRERFSRNGEYTPMLERSGDRIAINGLGFTGYLTRGGRAPARAVLGADREEELAQAFILENFLRIVMAHHVLDRGGVLLHSLGVVHRGRAYLLSGRSNAGKTTLARKAAAAGARVLSDDINLVIPEQGHYRAHKVPFTGEFGRQPENLSGSGSFPLGGVALLGKASALTAMPVTPAEAVAGLVAGCPFVNDDPEEFPALMDVLIRLVAETPTLRLGVARDDPFEAVIDAFLEQIEHG